MFLMLVLLVSFIAVSLIAYIIGRSLVSGYAEYEERYLNRTESILNEIYAIMPAERIMTLKVMSALLLAILAFLLCAEFVQPVPIVAAVLGAVLGSLIPDLALHMMSKRRKKKFNSQLIDSMMTISNGLRSGFSFQQAIELSARQLPDPAGQEFRLTVREMHLGVRTEDALENMNKRMNDRDLQLMVAAIRLTMQTGGDLPTVFNQISDTIRERNRIDGKINALTSQGKLQAMIVGLIPIGLAVIVNVINHELMSLMYTTLIGWVLIAAVLVLDVIGYLLIRRIVAIRF
jgi:tight adherence protein B